MLKRSDCFQDLQCTFTTDTLDEATHREGKRIFEDYVKRGVILNSAMENNTWKLTDEKHTVNLCFSLDLETYTRVSEEWLGCHLCDFQIALKIFVLMLLGTFALNGIQVKLYACRQLGCVSADDVQVDPCVSQSVLDFLSILPGSSSERDKVMESLAVKQPFQISNVRTLANFNVYVTFENRLSDLWERSDDPEKILLFPVYLWWTLTSILPLRPTEFLLTPRECLRPIHSPRQGSGRMEILVRRTRLKKGQRTVSYCVEEDYEIFAYGIPDAVSEMIDWYRKATDHDRQSSLGTLLIPNSSNAYFNYCAMIRLLQRTLNQLDMDPLSVHLGDTRHIAMISLILAGDTPSICKALANHESVDMSAGYYTNMATLSDCRTLRFLATQVHPVSLTPPPKHASFPLPGSLVVSDGHCNHYTPETFDARECAKVWDPVLGIGECHACPHFVPDSDAIFLQMENVFVDRAALNAQLVMEALEQLRRGKGKVETIEELVKRLRRDVTVYLDFSHLGHPWNMNSNHPNLYSCNKEEE